MSLTYRKLLEQLQKMEDNQLDKDVVCLDVDEVAHSPVGFYYKWVQKKKNKGYLLSENQPYFMILK